MLIYLTNKPASPLIGQVNLVTASLLLSVVFYGRLLMKPIIHLLFTHLVSLLSNTSGMLVTLWLVNMGEACLIKVHDGPDGQVKVQLTLS
jgi:hypothetical protein